MWNWLCYRVLGLNVIPGWICEGISRWDVNLSQEIRLFFLMLVDIVQFLKVYIKQKGRRRRNSFIFIISCHVVLEYESSARGLRFIPLANMVLRFGTHLKLYHHSDPSLYISDNHHMAKLPLVNLLLYVIIPSYLYLLYISKTHLLM